MMVNLFWTVATSYIALGVVATILIAALIVGYAPLLKWFPVIGEYVPLARLVSLLAMGLLCGLLATRMTAERYDAAQAVAQVKSLQARIALMNAVNRADAEQAAKNADEITRLRKLVGETPANTGPCLDKDAAKRIGNIR